MPSNDGNVHSQRTGNIFIFMNINRDGGRNNLYVDKHTGYIEYSLSEVDAGTTYIAVKLAFMFCIQTIEYVNTSVGTG